MKGLRSEAGRGNREMNSASGKRVSHVVLRACDATSHSKHHGGFRPRQCFRMPWDPDCLNLFVASVAFCDN